MRPVTGRSVVWGLSGVVTAAVLAASGTFLITGAGGTVDGAVSVWPQHTVRKTITVSQPVTSLTVNSYGAPVLVRAGNVSRVRVTETIAYEYDKAAGWPPPMVTRSVSGGRLTLAAPACAHSNCSVGFEITIPRNVSVTAVTVTGGGQLIIEPRAPPGPVPPGPVPPPVPPPGGGP
jgi:hypothetical protein